MTNTMTRAPFNMIRALSCHNIPTVNQPTVPIKLNHRSNIGKVPVARLATANKINTDDAHLTYHDRSCLGVIFLNTLDEFNAFILSFNFSFINTPASPNFKFVFLIVSN